MYNCVWYFCTYPYGLSLNVWHALLCIANNRHGVTITIHAIKRHFLIWMTTVRQPTKHRRSCVLTLRYTFICVYRWTRQRIHNTLIAVDRYLRRMGDKTIPDSAELRLESFYPPFVAGIDLPHQGLVDSYSLSLCLFLCLSVSLSVSNITDKRMNEFSWNFQDRWQLVQWTFCNILVMFHLMLCITFFLLIIRENPCLLATLRKNGLSHTPLCISMISGVCVQE